MIANSLKLTFIQMRIALILVCAYGSVAQVSSSSTEQPELLDTSSPG